MLLPRNIDCGKSEYFCLRCSNESVAVSISDVCLHIHETLKSKKVKGLVPEYNCLIVSPANLWGMDRAKFDHDGQIMKTVFKQYGAVLDTPPSIRGKRHIDPYYSMISQSRLSHHLFTAHTQSVSEGNVFSLSVQGGGGSSRYSEV